MNPSIKKLPKTVQSKLCASKQINSYAKAVEELVFNSLDADATSIAVRVNIADGSIQVVDNGCGISKSDFKSIGLKYMTSKLVDISTLKSAPNKYGFQGQSLANLTEISKTLKVTSRFDKCETTWVKTFENGKAKLPAKWNPRPSKGTTIEIKGFLHNLSIQRKSVNSINELQNIKIFLEHVSLLHSNISLSLRDDLNNEIVYQIHKNRDIYQTLSTLYKIKKSNVQELQVEKNQYKVKAYIGKHDADSEKQIIFLNGKHIPDSSPLQKKVYENLKNFCKSGQNKLNKHHKDEENNVFASRIPFYFIFISCPFMDYELNNTVLEFKDWGHINNLLDKLIKFYTGDVHLKAVAKNQVVNKINRQESESTRNRIDEIMKRILGTNVKKPDISYMQNGVKGKLIKRKPKKSKVLELIEEKERKKNNGKIYKPKLKTKIRKQSIKINESLSEKQSNLSKDTLISNINELTNTYSATPIENPKTIKRKTNPKLATTKAKLQNQSLIKDKKTKRNKDTLDRQFAIPTESVRRRCRLLLSARAKELSKMNIMNSKVLIDECSKHIVENFTQNNKNISVRTKVDEVVIHEYFPLPPKPNVGKAVQKHYKKNEFQSTYDLLQTIINSQFINDKQENYTIAPNNPNKSICDTYPRCMPLVRELQNVTPFQMEQIKFHDDSCDREQLRSNYDAVSGTVIPEFYDTPIVTVHDTKNPHEVRTPYSVDTPRVVPQDLLNPSEAESSDQNVTTMYDSVIPYKALTPDRHFLPVVALHDSLNRAPQKPILEEIIGSPFQAITFESHNYNNDGIQRFRTKHNDICSDKRQRNFITTQSKNIFLLNKIAPKKGRLNFRYSKPFLSNRNGEKFNGSIKMFNMASKMKCNNQESYTIEFTESNDYHNNNSDRYDNFNSMNIINNRIETITPSMSYIFTEHRNESYSPMMRPNVWFVSGNLDYEPIQHNNTVTIRNSHEENNIQISFNHENWNNHGTYTVETPITKFCENETPKIERYADSTRKSNDNVNYIFVSKTQDNLESQNINPIEVCETFLQDQELSMSRAREFDISFNWKQDYNPNDEVNYNNVDEVYDVQNVQKVPNNSMSTHVQTIQNQSDVGVISHHFKVSNTNNNDAEPSVLLNIKENANKPRNVYENRKGQDVSVNSMDVQNTGAFKIRDRLIFVPKGMSPIFKDCQAKTMPANDLEDEYYEDRIYDDFVDKVQNDAEIFKPRIDTGDATSKDNKIINKIYKSNASLKFDGLSIRNAKVLGQVDSKFIAAILKGKSEDTEDFLVLFDQHAVHERIRLENNLADYLTESQWKSVTIDKVSLKMTRDDILYLHNYREKFAQFGLEWSILNHNEITITAIPEGILGKNPRQVEKIIRAVKNLIREEIINIQMQRGCVSLYPKSIMDLVFSEACRYAIKFGDHLPKSHCDDLLKQLSECKTPFQCAHGRPAMAVILNFESNNVDYKVNNHKLQEFHQTK